MYLIKIVHRLPADLEDHVVYVSREYEVAALKCACGCGHRVNLLLDDGHKVEEQDGRAHIWPSIGVWDAPCRSHFWIQNGEVLWAEQWSEGRIRAAMEAQALRHKGDIRTPIPWYKKLWTALMKFYHWG
ncbi:MAG TPA: hypothetical protein DD435_09255 [Cyanobacteria bacterium UBA8530]|nr:hypothetical protein [Cyanobacteria bacterium UBA8530]